MAWLHVHYNSETLRMPVPMEVLLPQHVSGGSRQMLDPGPYKTLYLLHGMSEDHTAWMRRTSVERYVEGLPLAVVMPAGHLGGYTDMVYGRNYFKFITEELPMLCERMFPLSNVREDRFIAGASMGGYGAMKAGLAAAHIFGAAASFSGEMDVTNAFNRLDLKLATDIFGNKDALEGSVNDLFAAAQALSQSDQQQPELYMQCGTEDSLYEANARFKEYARQLGLTLTYEEGPGDHQWKYWDMALERMLQWLPLRKSIKG
ncbi:S-formylglutathione hydrolase FrmB [Paenibacillus sp. 1_12]|uniref:alpha/beta hydrolase n=1 Tax=Paenibacillus sp. 1_12 TaxID=1566278 RepID=UPI0008E4F642|nr:alpha/beta hydrolase family protein [Paenibacillus sp. 1_12]SFL64704.1 S-formylglutathione hydrolase FrmB [Paenibacillus sp. 1_12]